MFTFHFMGFCLVLIFCLWRGTSTTTLRPFNGFFSRTDWVSRHQKGKLFGILLEQRWWGCTISWTIYANHVHLAPDR